MPNTVRQALADGSKAIAGSESDSPRLDIEVLLAHALHMAREDLFINFDKVLTDSQQEKFNQMLARRVANEPVARILGFKEFWSMDFKLNEATLIPRPDSETLVAAVINYANGLSKTDGLKVLDLGTGTGCLLLSVLSELKTATGRGVDAEPLAVSMATENAKNLGLGDRAEFSVFNWLTGEGADLGAEKFDIIISNPPYIESSDIAGLQTEVAGFDPKLALDGGADGMLHYRVLAKFAKNYLQSGGCFFLEIGIGQTDDVSQIFNDNGWKLAVKHKDIAGVTRVLAFN